MKPLNLDNRPCSPTSSNCVIWQGPDIPCIEICNGDSISDVVAALATELCTILDQTNVNNYDLSCLGITACGPKNFQALIQLLIDKICELQGITPGKIDSASGCPDCVVTVAPCFQTGNVTTMQLLDYVQMIAERVCSLIDQISVINTQITDILIRLEDLENAPVPETNIPAFTLGCTIGNYSEGSTQFINVLLQEFINNVWCDFYNTTGSTTDLISAINAICIEDSDLQLTTGTPFSTNPSWIQSGSYDTVADAINNIWVALCDVYNAVNDISLNVEDTTTVNLTYASSTLSANIQDTGWHCLLGFDSYMNTDPGTEYQYPQVRRIGNQLHFRGTIVIPLATGGGSVLPWIYTSTINNYEGDGVSTPVTLKDPYVGTGGVVLQSYGLIQFNRNASGNPNSVIPLAVLPAGYSIDGGYSHPAGFKVMQRSIQIGTDTSTILTTLSNISISTAGLLSLSLLKNNEESYICTNNAAFDTSHLNYIVSHVTAGEFVPKFNSSGTTLYDNPASGTQPADINFAAGLTYPFDCNANDENDIGGFFTRLDGLVAFIGPCVTPSIPTPTLDTNACNGTCS